MQLLAIKNLSVRFQLEEDKNAAVSAVNNVSLEINTGETLGIVGESGCGKSVTAMSIPQLIPMPPGEITSGEILFKGKDMRKATNDELRDVRGKEIGVIFQEPMTALSPLHTIGDQLAEVLEIHTKLTKAEQKIKILEWLRKVGIPAPETRISAYPFELSGGMRQRVMIAMAMLLEPSLIIADEPTTALDVTIQAQILQLIRTIRGDKCGVLLITHDMGVIWEMCDTMAVMYASRIVETGRVKDIFAHPRHPYTKLLMESIPALAAPGEKLPHIPGQVPSLANLPKGCAFASRCPFADDKCLSHCPELTDGVACIHPIQ